MARANTTKKSAPNRKKVVDTKKVINKASDKRPPATKKEVRDALADRKKLVLQKRNKDTIVYCRMKPPMYDLFEEAYAKYVTDNLLNPASYGMSTFVRENAFANLKAKRSI